VKENLITILISSILASWIATIVTINAQQHIAVKHNAASYVCNPQTGETVFKWKDEQ